nr:hypothetical protein GCM10020185_51650 [Pseudomonas brassicacearum subsp. brassicacearum]
MVSKAKKFRWLKVRLEVGVSEFHRRAVSDPTLGIPVLIMGGGQQAVAQLGRGVFQQQPTQQRGFVVGSGRELVKHQHLMAQAPGAHLEAVPVSVDRIAA